MAFMSDKDIWFSKKKQTFILTGIDSDHVLFPIINWSTVGYIKYYSLF